MGGNAPLKGQWEQPTRESVAIWKRPNQRFGQLVHADVDDCRNVLMAIRKKILSPVWMRRCTRMHSVHRPEIAEIPAARDQTVSGPQPGGFEKAGQARGEKSYGRQDCSAASAHEPMAAGAPRRPRDRSDRAVAQGFAEESILASNRQAKERGPPSRDAGRGEEGKLVGKFELEGCPRERVPSHCSRHSLTRFRIPLAGTE